MKNTRPQKKLIPKSCFLGEYRPPPQPRKPSSVSSEKNSGNMRCTHEPLPVPRDWTNMNGGRFWAPTFGNAADDLCETWLENWRQKIARILIL